MIEDNEVVTTYLCNMGDTVLCASCVQYAPDGITFTKMSVKSICDSCSLTLMMKTLRNL